MKLCDVTIRESEQMPGRTYSVEQKVDVGIELDELGVDVIQAGFPPVGPGHEAVVEQLAETVDAEVSALARALPRDVDAAVEANADIVEVMAPVSDVQLKHVVDEPFEEMRDQLLDAIERVREYGVTASATAMDAFRAPPERLAELAEYVERDVRLTLADTVGVCTPTKLSSYLETLFDDGRTPGRFGVHFHDDLGVATANTLLACVRGVGRADVSVASLGERAGNTALEEVVVASSVGGVDGIDVRESDLVSTCKRVLEKIDEDVHVRKPILGRDVTRHESGLHTAAMLTDPGSFEAYDPEGFGGERVLLFSRQSGRRSVQRLIERAGYEPTSEAVDAVLERLADGDPLEHPAALALVDETLGAD